MEKPSDDSQWIDGTVLEIPSDKCPVILDPLTRLNFRILIGDVRYIFPSSISKGLFTFNSHYVSYVDIIGVVCHIDVRQNYYHVQVDDGTGQLSCTIWRKHVAPDIPNRLPGNNQSADNLILAQKLVRLAVRATPVNFLTCDGNICSSSPSLALGDTVHLRGRLQLFREAITFSANYCRMVKDPQEVLDSVLQAYNLKTRVYSKPYNPAQIFEHLKADLPKSLNCGLLQRIQRIIEADRLFHFTALDLQLHAQVIHEIRVSSELIADELWCEPDWETVPPQNGTREATTSRSLESTELKNRIQGIIDQFLKEGIVFRSADPIGGMCAYHGLEHEVDAEKIQFLGGLKKAITGGAVVEAVEESMVVTGRLIIYTLRNRRLAKHVCQIISLEQKNYEKGVPFDVILEKLRLLAPVGGSHRPYRSVTRPALAKLINRLLERSQIYIVNPNCYKMA